MKRTFMMLKPDAFKYHNEKAIIKDIESANLKIVRMKKIRVDMEFMKVLLEHYHGVIDEMDPDFNFAGKLFKSFYYDENYIMPMIVEYSGDDIIAYTRQLVGKTNPQDAEKNSLRHKYSHDSYTLASKENRLVENVIHASDSDESAKREISLWEIYL